MSRKQINGEVGFETVKVRPSVHKELVEFSRQGGVKIYALIKLAWECYKKSNEATAK